MSTTELSKVGQDGPGGSKKEKNQNIQVYVRVRPMNSQEVAKHTAEVVDTPGSREVVVRERTVSNITKTFTFDKVFGTNSKQVDVYKTVVAPLLQEVLLGYNCTVFAYGQTGTGKTFTMEGDRSLKSTDTFVEKDPLVGILPRALSQLFDDVRTMNCEYSVRVSFLELYNEELFDLLSPIEENKHKQLRLYEDGKKNGSLIISGLEEVIVNNKLEVYSVLERGSQQRKTAATLMNATSSRSHTVFTITIHMKENSVVGEEMVKIGKLNLVDLAGSENIGKSGAVDKRAREAGSINQSLLTLGRVISALVERTPHVPYRESKLTRILQDSLGGKTKTSIIATVSPSSINIEETLSTLDYAHRAKNIMNKPEVNQRLTKKEALNIYTEEIERLRRDLNATRERNGIYVDSENYQFTLRTIDSQRQELHEKIMLNGEMEETLAKREAELDDAFQLIDELKQDVAVKNALLEETQRENDFLANKLDETTGRVDELQHLVQCHTDTEAKLSDEARDLLSATSHSVTDLNTLHARIERQKDVADKNWKSGGRLRLEIHAAVNEIADAVGQLRSSQAVHSADIRAKAKTRVDDRRDLQEVFQSSLRKLASTMTKVDQELVILATAMLGTTQSRIVSDSFTISEKFTAKKLTMADNSNALQEMMRNLKGSFGNLKADITKLKTDVEGKFDNLRGEVTTTLTCNISAMEGLEKTIETQKIKLDHVASEFEKYLTAFRVNQHDYKKDYQRKLEFIQDKLNELSEDTEKYMCDSSQSTMTLVKTFETFTSGYQDDYNTQVQSITNAKERPKKTIASLAKHREEIVIAQKERLDGMFQKVDDSMNASRKIEKKLTDTQTSQEAGLVALEDSVENYGSVYVEQIGLFRQELEKQISTGASESEIVREVISDTFNHMLYVDETIITEMSDETEKQLDLTSEACTNFCSALQHTAGSVDEFWDETYIVDRPTGVTPLRRNYIFPTKLTVTSPHDRVLQRYRTMANEYQSAMEGCDSADDSTASGNERELKTGRNLEKRFENENTENRAPKISASEKLGIITENDERSDGSEDAKSISGSSETGTETTNSKTQKASDKARDQAPKKAPASAKKARRKSGGKKGVLKPPN